MVDTGDHSQIKMTDMADILCRFEDTHSCLESLGDIKNTNMETNNTVGW